MLLTLWRSWSWTPQVFSVELKKAFSYRVAFWISFLLGTTTELLVAYFLWKAIFETRGAQTLEGFSFAGILYYYLFANLSMKIVRGAERGYISQDIYDGGLNRYLVFPLPFLGFKFVTHLALQLLATLQLGLAFFLLRAFVPLPMEEAIHWRNFLAGVLTCYMAGVLYFFMASCLEMVAFWQDVVWNLMVMLRFIMSLLGGALIPLAFFPEWGRQVALLTPFPALISFPARTFLGRVSLEEWLQFAGVIALWAILFLGLAYVIWKRGTRQYSGVGI